MRTLASLRESDLWYWQQPDEDIVAFLEVHQRRLRKHRPTKPRNQPHLENAADLVQVIDGRCRFDPHSLPVDLAGTEAIPRTVRSLLRAYRRTLEGHQQRFLEGFQLVDTQLRDRGIGEPGTHRFLALLQKPDGESLVLQVTEARASLLTRHLPNSVYRNQGKRIAAGQRLIGAADDLLLGWVRDDNGRDHYVRQGRFPTVSVDVRSLTAQTMAPYAALCGATLARAHARGGDRITIAAYLGKRDRFDRAIASFAESYANQIEHDYQALVRAVRSGQITTSAVAASSTHARSALDVAEALSP
jgi:hypothetical protein